MDGFTVKNADRFIQSGTLDGKSLRIDSGSKSSTSDIAGAGGSGQTSFVDTLKQAMGEVNTLQKKSDKAMQDLATGRTDNVADVMIAAEKADIALRVMMQVRNKIVDAYNEIMKMQV